MPWPWRTCLISLLVAAVAAGGEARGDRGGAVAVEERSGPAHGRAAVGTVVPEDKHHAACALQMSGDHTLNTRGINEAAIVTSTWPFLSV